MKNIENQLNSTLICVFKIQRQFYSHKSKNNLHQSETSKNLNLPIGNLKNCEFTNQRSNKSGRILNPTQKQKPFSNG